MQPYTPNFYEYLESGARQSAKEIVPLILELIQPQQVIDIGCGVGTWLSVFHEYGIKDILGVDGDYVDLNMLQIPKEKFLSFDLAKPFLIDRKFDLVMSLEVAEHIASEYTEIFIDSLVNLGSVILFSAAIPQQGGANHVNEQWAEYWVTHFQERGYVVIDCIRRKVWKNDKVEPWYAQNMLIFVDQNALSKYPLLESEFSITDISQLSVVHPRHYLSSLVGASDLSSFPLYKLLSAIPLSIGNELNALKESLKKSLKR